MLAIPPPGLTFGTSVPNREHLPVHVLDPRCQSCRGRGAGTVHIRLGGAPKNRKVRLLIAGTDVRIVSEDGQLLRSLTLDPKRDYYGLGGRWPAHNALRQVRTMS